MREIVFYRTESGVSPITDFLDSLSGKQAQKVLWVLRSIEELDIVPSQYLKKLINTKDPKNIPSRNQPSATEKTRLFKPEIKQ